MNQKTLLENQLSVCGAGIDFINGLYIWNENRFSKSTKLNDNEFAVNLYQKYIEYNNIGCGFVISTTMNDFETIYYVIEPSKLLDKWVPVGGIYPIPNVKWKIQGKTTLTSMVDIFYYQMVNTIHKCDPYCSHRMHPFQYVLSKEQLNKLHEFSSRIVSIYHNDAPKESPKPIKTMNMIHQDVIENKQSCLYLVHSFLTLFFKSNPDNVYFIRLSTVSPKDARIYLDNNNLCEYDDLKDITMDIQELKVGVSIQKSPQQASIKCIQLLCHSERIKYEIQLNTSTINTSLLLLNWKSINIKTETRCYITKWKIVCISQYYSDLNNVYGSENIPTLYYAIIKYLNTQIKFNKHKMAHLNGNFVIDLDIDISNPNDIIIDTIEYNGLWESDKCLYDLNLFEELCNDINNDSYIPSFRYIINTKICQFIPK